MSTHAPPAASGRASPAGATTLVPPRSPAASPSPDAALEKQAPPPAERQIRGAKWVAVVVAILSSTFLFSLDNTVVADVQPTVTREFGSVDKLPWLSVGYLLGSTTTNLLWYGPSHSGGGRAHPSGARSTPSSMANGSTSSACCYSSWAPSCAVRRRA